MGEKSGTFCGWLRVGDWLLTRSHVALSCSDAAGPGDGRHAAGPGPLGRHARQHGEVKSRQERHAAQSRCQEAGKAPPIQPDLTLTPCGMGEPVNAVISEQ